MGRTEAKTRPPPPGSRAPAESVSRLVREQPAYASSWATRIPAKSKPRPRVIGQARHEVGRLQREQLAAWFTHVRQLQNHVIAAALQVMLLTGARPGEVLALHWDRQLTRNGRA